MAFPPIFDGQFEVGDGSEWSGGFTDVDGKFAVRHYTELVRRLGQYPDAMPYRGSYAAHLDLSGGTNDATLTDTSWATALGGTIWAGFYFQATSNLLMAANDRFTILSLDSVGPVSEAVVDIRFASGRFQLLAAETGASATVRNTDLILNQWHLIELKVTVDSGANNGVITFYVDGYQVGATITGLTQGALTQARIGAMGIDAGTTAGHLLFDQVMADDTRIFGFPERYPQSVMLTKSANVAAGPGRILEYVLEAGGALDNSLEAYDSDESNINAEAAQVGPRLTNDAVNKAIVFPFSKSDGYFNRGLYIRLQGTTPRAHVIFGDRLSASGAIKAYATSRNPHGTF